MESIQLRLFSLFNTKVDLNCIQEGLVQTKFFKKTKEGLRSTNKFKLQRDYKLSDVVLENSYVKVKIKFLLVKNMTSKIILGSSFIH